MIRTSTPTIPASSAAIVLALALGACGGASTPAARATPANRGPVGPRVTLSGTVVDETGRPLAGAEVLVCADMAPCSAISDQALLTPRPLSAIVHAARTAWTPALARVLRTGPDGRWHASPAIPPGNDAVVLATAPGRELVLAGGAPSLAEQQVRRITLRPAVPIRIDPTCGGAPCTGHVVGRVDDGAMFHGRTLERLPAGPHTLVVTVGPDAPGEHRGMAGVDTRGASGPVTVRPDLQPTGTGKSITGSVHLTRDGEDRSAHVSVSARCNDVERTAVTDGTGHFEIADAGPPPCRVELMVSGGPGDDVVEADPVLVTELPARDVAIEGYVDRAEHAPDSALRFARPARLARR